MILNKLCQRFKLNKQINACLLCSKPIEVISEKESLDEIVETTEQKKETKIKKKRPPSKRHVLELEQLFHENPDLSPFKRSIPEKLLTYTPYSRPEYIYLISPNIAKKVAKHVLLSLNKNNGVVAETNPGFGHIAQELIKGGVPVMRLYESNTEFQQILKDVSKENTGKVQLFKKDFFKMHIFSYVDRFDQGSRVASLLEGVPKKSWVDDPVITIVGTLTNLSFVKYLIKSVVMQREIATYGRIEIFALIFPMDWAILTATKDDSSRRYKPWLVLFQIFFEAKLLDSFPRKFFLPWEAQKGTKKRIKMQKFDPDNIYLVQMSMKKDFSLNAEEFMPFFCFIKTFLGSGNKIIIPTCEKWVPECGINLIAPKLKHEDYFEDMNIFTKFKELTPKQIVAVFKEITSLPGYHKSPFSDMIEQELIKTETISSDLHATHKYKMKITDFELK